MGLMTGFIIFIMIGKVYDLKKETDYKKDWCWTLKVVFVWVVKRREERAEVKILESDEAFFWLIIFFQREHRLQQEMILANQWSTKDDLLPNQPRKVCHRGVFW